MLAALLPGPHDRCAARHLDDRELRGRSAQKAQPAEFGEGLRHANDAGAAAGRIDDPVRQPPAELFGDLEAHRLLALDAVRLAQGGKIPKAAAAFLQRGAGVDQRAARLDNLRAESKATFSNGRRSVFRQPHAAGQPGRRGISRRRDARVPCARKLNPGGAEFTGAVHGQGESPVLERARRIPRLVLDEDAHAIRSRASKPQNGSAALAQIDPTVEVGHRQQLAVPPQGPRSVTEVAREGLTPLPIQLVAYEPRLARGRQEGRLVQRRLDPGCGANQPPGPALHALTVRLHLRTCRADPSSAARALSFDTHKPLNNNNLRENCAIIAPSHQLLGIRA